MDEPVLIGPSIDEVLDRVLHEAVAQKRRKLQEEHVEQVRALWDHFREVCRRRLLEIALPLKKRFGDETAAMMAVVKFASEKRVMQHQLDGMLDVLQERLQLTLERLVVPLQRPRDPETPAPDG